jgi:hypothetical protein
MASTFAQALFRLRLDIQAGQRAGGRHARALAGHEDQAFEHRSGRIGAGGRGQVVGLHDAMCGHAGFYRHTRSISLPPR